jgi:hypothetical protein
VRATANGSAQSRRWRWGGAFSVVRVGGRGTRSIGKEEHFVRHPAPAEREGKPHCSGNRRRPACRRHRVRCCVRRRAAPFWCIVAVVGVVEGLHIARLVAASCDSAAPVARGGDRPSRTMLAHCGPGVHPSLTAIYPPTAICTHPPSCVDSLPSAEPALLFLCCCPLSAAALPLHPSIVYPPEPSTQRPPRRIPANHSPQQGFSAPHTTTTNCPAFTCTAPHRRRVRGTHPPPSDRASPSAEPPCSTAARSL